MSHLAGSLGAERTVRRSVVEVTRSLRSSSAPAGDSAFTSAAMAAVRRFAFLWLLNQAAVPECNPGLLERHLGESLQQGDDRYYPAVVLPLCARFLGEIESPPGCVPDLLFRKWLDLFRTWRWNSGEDSGAEFVTPALLGALCEDALDQKTHGAYFTSPDVTAYVCATVLLPALLDAVRTAGHTRTDGRSGLLPGWSPPAIVDAFLPPARREPNAFAGETDRERTARLQRVARCRQAWNAGDVRSPDDFITWNLDLPALVRDWIRETTDLPALSRFWRALANIRILDPTCGSGAFLLGALETLLPVHHAMRERLAQPGPGAADVEIGWPETEIVARIVAANLHGVDQSAEAVETSRMRLLLRVAAAGGGGSSPRSVEALRSHLRRGDVLTGELFAEGEQEEAGFDAVVGNPPYVGYVSGGKYTGAGYQTESSDNLYALVTERATQLLRPGGRLGMILPVSSTSLEGFRPLADLLRRGNAWVSTYSNRPAKLFPGVEQRLAIWITGPSGRPTTSVSAYQHWYAGERSHLFSRLEYVPASTWAQTGMPIKSGSAVAEGLFRKITAQAGRLGSFEERGGGGAAAVWLHDGPTYWVRALAFPPHPEVSAGPGHYHRIAVQNPERAQILGAILSSSLFYFFFKMVSNCRDLGRKEWAAFPIDPLPRELEREVVTLGSQFQERLRSTARARSRRYPRGVVEYREYYPARAKSILDEVDRTLARHYELSAEETDYLLNYDLKYRMGQSDAG